MNIDWRNVAKLIVLMPLIVAVFLIVYTIASVATPVHLYGG